MEKLRENFAKLDRSLKDFFSGKPVGLKPRHWVPPLIGVLFGVLALSLADNESTERLGIFLLWPGNAMAKLGGWGGHDSSGFLCLTLGNSLFYGILATLISRWLTRKSRSKLKA